MIVQPSVKADAETAASLYRRSSLNEIIKFPTLDNRFSSMDQTTYIERVCHLRLSKLEQKLLLDLKTSNYRLILLSGSNAVGDFKLNPIFTYHFKNYRAFTKYAKFTQPVFCKLNNKLWMIAHLFKTQYTNILNPLLRPATQKKIPPVKM